MKIVSRILKPLIVVIIAGAISGGSILAYTHFHQEPAAHPEGKTDIDLSVLKESMEKNNELSTAKYLYTDSVSITDQNTLEVLGLGDVALPFTDATYIIEFDGVIKAGYNLDEADVYKEGDSTVVVELPQAKVLSHETGDAELVYEQQNIANPLHAGEESEWLEEQKATMQARAESLGLFEEAQQNAKITFESLFASAIPEGATLEIRFRGSEQGSQNEKSGSQVTGSTGSQGTAGSQGETSEQGTTSERGSEV